MTGAEPAPTPRSWVGERPFPWPRTLSLPDGADVAACFTVLGLKVTRTPDSVPLLRVQLADRYGTVEGALFADVAAAVELLRPGMYVGVRGRIDQVFDGRTVLIEEIAPIHIELDDLVLFLPASPRSAAVMDAELDALVASIGEQPLRELVQTLLTPASDTGRGFRLAPAAKQNHHAYLGGLLEHTLSVTHICDFLAVHYGSAIDRDLLITGALLHDIGKIREIGARSGFPYTDEGKLLGHLVLGMQMVADTAARIAGLDAQRVLLVQHLLASHQGRYEWQSPREPRTLEALVLHYVDDLDAKLHQAGALTAAVERGWTQYDRSFGRDFLRHLDAALGRNATPTASGARPQSDAPADTNADAADRRPNRRPQLDTLDLFEG